MNSPGETSNSNTRPCERITSLFPFGMSCRGRAESFARRLESKLRTLGSSQASTTTQISASPDNDPNTTTENTWLTATHQNDGLKTNITNLQPLRRLSNDTTDSFFDFDIEPDESPGSPIDECEYTRLIETATPTSTSTPQHDNICTESGYVCSSPISIGDDPYHNHNNNNDAAVADDINRNKSNNHSNNGYEDDSQSSDGQYFDPDNSEFGEKSLSISFDYYDCMDTFKKDFQQLQYEQQVGGQVKVNGHNATNNGVIGEEDGGGGGASGNCNSIESSNGFPSLYNDSDSCSESLPLSQSTTASLSTCTIISSTSNSTLQLIDDIENCSIFPENLEETINLCNNTALHERMAEEININDNNNNNIDEDNKLKLTIPIGNESDGGGGGGGGDVIVSDHRTEDEEYLASTPPQKLRRCSSLKTGKTPPGTPGRKKIVRFADVLGLDLADVRTFMDDIPKIPKSAFEDLDIPNDTYDQSALSVLDGGARFDKMLMPMFQQPGGLAHFLELVKTKQVCLENAAVTDPISCTITGCVRVRNLDFHKSVHIRYTYDAWRSYADLQATYVENSCDGFSDKFSFIMFGNTLQIGQQIEMAVRFSCRGQQFWDNNFGSNYCFQCLPTTTIEKQSSSSSSSLSSTSTSLSNRCTAAAITTTNARSLLNEDTWCNTFY